MCFSAIMYGQEDSRSLEDESSKDVAASVPSHHVPVRLRNTSLAAHQENKTGAVAPQVSGLSTYGGPSPAKKPRTIAGRVYFCVFISFTQVPHFPTPFTIFFQVLRIMVLLQ